MCLNKLLRYYSQPKPKSYPLQQRLELATRAETPTDPSELGDLEYSSLRRRCIPSEIDDGLWVCACGFENGLIHWKGAHPFKHVKCGKCNRVIHPTPSTALTPSTSEILTPITITYPRKIIVHAWPDTGDVPYGQVCPDCGLSHRAKARALDFTSHEGQLQSIDFNDAICHCGRQADSQWLCFYIGSPARYWRDSNQSYADLVVQRAELSTQTQQTGVCYSPIDRRMKRPPPPYQRLP